MAIVSASSSLLLPAAQARTNQQSNVGARTQTTHVPCSVGHLSFDTDAAVSTDTFDDADRFQPRAGTIRSIIFNIERWFRPWGREGFSVVFL